MFMASWYIYRTLGCECVEFFYTRNSLTVSKQTVEHSKCLIESLSLFWMDDAIMVSAAV
jgi:hypothetical protein